MKYVEKVCQKHPGLHRPNIETPIRTAATNQLSVMLTNQMQSTVATEQRSQRLEAMMLLDPHEKYAKNIGIEVSHFIHNNFNHDDFIHNNFIPVKSNSKFYYETIIASP